MGWEKSDIKNKILETLLNWNHSLKKASVYHISNKIQCSESSVTKILRFLHDCGIADKSRGSWFLVNKEVVEKILLRERDDAKADVES